MGIGRGRAADTDKHRPVPAPPFVAPPRPPRCDERLVIAVPWSGDPYRQAANIAAESARRMMPDAQVVMWEYNEMGDQKFLNDTYGLLWYGKAVLAVQAITERYTNGGHAVLVLSADSLMHKPFGWKPSSDKVVYAACISKQVDPITRNWLDVAKRLAIPGPEDLWADPVNIWSRIPTRPIYEQWAKPIFQEMKATAAEASSHHMVFGTVLYRLLESKGMAEPLGQDYHYHCGGADGRYSYHIKERFKEVFGEAPPED